MSAIFPVSLGCPKNLKDMEQMLATLVKHGYTIVAEPNSSCTVIINTCGFIQPAIEESNDTINEYLALKRAGQIKKLIVTGCLVERERKTIQDDFPEVDAMVSIAGETQIIQAIEEGLNALPPPPTDLRYNGNLFLGTAPHTAYLKIADGCDNRCSYCTIPQIRGGYRSKPIDDIIIEATDMVARGVKEISLIAQDTTSYGIDLYKRPQLPELLSRLTKVRDLTWIRILYAYPEQITPELLTVMRDAKNVCSYLDMPLQHIADPILRSMKRRSSEKDVRQTLVRIKEAIPDIAIRTNFIVGYPGETEQDFETLNDFVAEGFFAKVGVFTYWPEKGTAAAKLPQQITEAVKKERYDTLIDTQSRVIKKMNKTLIGKDTLLLMDTPYIGRSHSEAPDIDGSYHVDRAMQPGAFVSARITRASGYHREATILSS